MKARNTAEIIEKKGKLSVRISLADGSYIYADRTPSGRIIFDSPERVPRVLKHTVVPDLFKEIERRLFTMATE
jgi:hypothetical protein